MTNDRGYREALTVAAALDELERCSGSQFDPHVVDALVAVLASEAAADRRRRLRSIRFFARRLYWRSASTLRAWASA